MTTPKWVRKALEGRGIPYTELHHSRAYTSQEVAQREHVSGHRVAKVVVAMADGKPVELVLPASRRVALEQLRELLGARDVRLATETEIERYFNDCEVGAIPPLRHWQDIEVLMDSTLGAEDDILFQAGTHEDAVLLRFADWQNAVNPRIGTFSEPADIPVRRWQSQS
jgi:Ala-tRNA(Pro) deacylase